MNPLQCELCGHKGKWCSVYPKKAIVKCPNCQLVFYDKKVDTTSLYTEDYFKGGEYADYLADMAIYRMTKEEVEKRKDVLIYTTDLFILCILSCSGIDRVINPTVLGERCRFNWHEIFALPFISKKILIVETESEGIFYHLTSRIYNRIAEFYYVKRWWFYSHRDI